MIFLVSFLEISFAFLLFEKKEKFRKNPRAFL